MGLFITCRNPFKHNLQTVFDNWLVMFSDERKLSYEEMECMQFVFVIMLQDKLRRFPFSLLTTPNYIYKTTDRTGNYKLFYCFLIG